MKIKKLGILTPLFILCLTSCGEVSHDISEYVLKLPYKENFKILQLSDIHLANKDDQQRQFDFLDLTINDANADLIVVTGDNFTFADKTTANRYFEWLDSHNTPWTITFGNHDEQCYFSIDWLTGRLNELNNSDDSYCIFKDIQDDDVFGNANFSINLVENNDIKQTKQQIIIMDSNRYYFGDYWGYDSIHEDQIEWYERLVDYTTSEVGHVVDSYAFFHIPLPEMQVAYDAACEELETGIDNPDVEFIHNNRNGTIPENVSCPKINTGFFDVIVEKGSTKALFYGHDHIDNYALKYKGIIMSYGVNSTDRIYFTEELIGGQVITLQEGADPIIEGIFHEYSEYDGGNK